MPVNRIGYLSPLAAAAAAPYLEAFRQGLRELGYVEGQNFTIESRFAGGKFDRLPELAVELIGQRVDVMLVGSNPGALAAKSAPPAASEEAFHSWRSLFQGLAAGESDPEVYRVEGDPIVEHPWTVLRNTVNPINISITTSDKVVPKTWSYSVIHATVLFLTTGAIRARCLLNVAEGLQTIEFRSINRLLCGIAPGRKADPFLHTIVQGGM